MKLSIEFENEHTKITLTTTQLPKLNVSPPAIHAFITGIQRGYSSQIADIFRRATKVTSEPEPEAEDVPGYPRWFVAQRTSVAQVSGLHWLMYEEEDGTIVRTEDVTRAMTFSTLEGVQRFTDHWWHKSLATRTRSGLNLELASWEVWRQSGPGGCLVPNVQHDSASIPFGPERSDDGH